MSGRQQHYLPQFLQRNFSFRASGTEDYVRVFRKHSTFESNTSGVGKQRDFYGHPDSSNADAVITAGESQLAEIVQSLITAGPTEEVNQQHCAILAASISLRTKSMRESIKAAGEKMLGFAQQRFDATALAGKEYDRFFADTRGISRLVNEQLAEAKLDRNQAAVFKQRAMNQIRRDAAATRDARIFEITSQFQHVMDNLFKEAGRIADKAFLGIFEESAAPQKRIELFGQMHYSIETSVDPHSYILGDCGTIAVQSDGAFKLALGNIDDELLMEEVWLPLSPSLAVVGRRGSFRSNRTSREINTASAALSTDFFISHSEADPTLDALRGTIGSLEPLLTKEELLALGD